MSKVRLPPQDYLTKRKKKEDTRALRAGAVAPITNSNFAAVVHSIFFSVNNVIVETGPRPPVLCVMHVLQDRNSAVLRYNREQFHSIFETIRVINFIN